MIVHSVCACRRPHRPSVPRRRLPCRRPSGRRLAFSCGAVSVSRLSISSRLINDSHSSTRSFIVCEPAVLLVGLLPHVVARPVASRLVGAVVSLALRHDQVLVAPPHLELSNKRLPYISVIIHRVRVRRHRLLRSCVARLRFGCAAPPPLPLPCGSPSLWSSAPPPPLSRWPSLGPPLPAPGRCLIIGIYIIVAIGFIYNEHTVHSAFA